MMAGLLIIGHLITGQSLALGVGGEPPISTVATYPTRALAVRTTGTPRFIPLAYPTTERIGAGMLNRLIAHGLSQGRSEYRSANVFGLGGATYAELKKGTTTYNSAIAAMVTGKSLATAAGDSFRVDYLHFLHGGSEQGDGTSAVTYAGHITELQADFSADLIAAGVNPPSHQVKALVCQSSNWTATGTSTVATVPLGQLQAHRDNPHVYLVGPRILPLGPDGIHLTNVGYFRLGEHHAEAVIAIESTGTHEPLGPKSVTIEGRVALVGFHVRVPPLAFDTEKVPPQPNYGLSGYHNAGECPIEAVELQGTTAVKVTLVTPPGPGFRVAYASRLDNGRGNLRDSDPSVSAHDGAPLYNWCVAFDDPAGLSAEPSGTVVASSQIVHVSPLGDGRAYVTERHVMANGETLQFTELREAGNHQAAMLARVQSIQTQRTAEADTRARLLTARSAHLKIAQYVKTNPETIGLTVTEQESIDG